MHEEQGFTEQLAHYKLHTPPVLQRMGYVLVDILQYPLSGLFARRHFRFVLFLFLGYLRCFLFFSFQFVFFGAFFSHDFFSFHW